MGDPSKSQSAKAKAASMAAGLVMALSACGQGYGSAGPAALDAPEVQAAAQQSHEIYQQIWGNANEREASNFLSHWALNGAVGQCMTDAGYPWHAPMAYNAIGYAADGGGGTVWLGALDQKVSDWLLRSDLLNEPAQEAMNFIPGKNSVVLTQGYRDQLDECDKLRGDPER